MPYNYNRHRIKRVRSEAELTVAQMLQTVLIEVVTPVGEGKQKYEDGDVEAAEALFKKALEMSPSHPEANYRMAVLLRVMARVEEAIPLFEKVAQGDSEWKEKAEQALETLRHGRPVKTL